MKSFFYSHTYFYAITLIVAKKTNNYRISFLYIRKLAKGIFFLNNSTPLFLASQVQSQSHFHICNFAHKRNVIVLSFYCTVYRDSVHAISFYRKRSLKEKRPIEFGFIRNKDPLNFSTIRNEKIKKALNFQETINYSICIKIFF